MKLNMDNRSVLLLRRNRLMYQRRLETDCLGQIVPQKLDRESCRTVLTAVQPEYERHSSFLLGTCQAMLGTSPSVVLERNQRIIRVIE